MQGSSLPVLGPRLLPRAFPFQEPKLLGLSRDTVRALVRKHGVRTEVRVVVARP
jgi:hypothetical protein